MFLNVLDKKRINALIVLKEFKNDFYLAGGTGLALQLGHRDSVDFDFFCEEDFDTSVVLKRIKNVFLGKEVIIIQNEENTLTVIVDGSIKISFFSYKYKMIDKMVETEYLRIASIRDIACMKFSAITSRYTSKDYVDLYFILKKFKLKDLLVDLRNKMPEIDTNLALKSLAYFEDIEKERIKFRNGNNVEFKKVQDFLTKESQRIYG
jgi:hypothetical protein